MASVTFDTLKFVEKLRAAGVSEPQAKAQAEVLVFALAEVMDQQMATKADFAALDRGVKAEFKELRADFAALAHAVKGDIAAQDHAVKAEFKELRADFAAQEKAIRADFAAQEKAIRADIIPLQRDSYVIKWMMGMVLAGVTTLILKTFFPG